MSVPLIETTQAEEASTLAVETADKNYAPEAGSESALTDSIRALVEVLHWTRNERVGMEDDWNAIRRMTLLQHDSGQKYKGRSNAYLPVYNRTRTTLTSSLSQGLFPSDDYFDVATPVGDPERGKRIKGYLQWELDVIGRVRTKMKPFLSQLVDIGTSALKYWYRTDIKNLGKAKFAKDVARKFLRQQTFTPSKTYDGLCVSSRNMHNLYVYPVTADSPDEVDIVFEDISVPRRFVEEMLRKKRWINETAAMNAPIETNFLNNQQTMLQDAAGMSAPETSPVTGTFAEMLMVTEVWVDLVLPSAAYAVGEDPEMPVPCRVVLAGDIALEIRRNPFWHQKPPYLFTRLNTRPGYFYGEGFGHVHRSLQYLANDFINQTNDCGIYGLNPMVAVKPSSLVGPLPAVRPGATIQVTDLDALKFFNPPIELVQSGMQMVNAIVGMDQDFGGAPPILNGSGAGKAGKTATQSQILQRNAQQPLQDIVEDIELEVLVPLLKGTWSNCLQYRDPDELAQLIGEDLILSPEAVAADYEFRWLASSQATNQQVRAQQAMQLLQIMMTPPVMQTLQMQGMQFDPVPILKRLYSDGFGFRGFDEIVKPMPPPPGMMPGMPPPGLEGAQGAQGAQGMQGAPADRMRSATEQSPEGGIAAQPGEADDFMGVRQNADMLAGMMGQFNAPGDDE